MEIYAVMYQAETINDFSGMAVALRGNNFDEVYYKAWEYIKLEYPAPHYFNHKVSLIKVPDTWIKQAYEETYNA